MKILAICTECNKELTEKDFVIDDNYEGCTCYGHKIKKEHLEELKNEFKGL